MITILRNLWYSREARKKELAEKLEEEHTKLDLLIDQENINQNENHVIETSFPTRCIDEVSEDKKCFRCKGVITALRSDNGTIDHGIFFEMSAALCVADELYVGCRIEYLAYKHAETGHLKVVKIDQVLDHYWNEETPTDEKIHAEIKELSRENPMYFNTHQRNILGLIVKRNPDSIIVDTDYKTMNIHLDNVAIDFIPQKGDRVFVCCNVQSDELFVDKNGEILEEVSVHPARLMKSEKCTVKRLDSGWGILNHDTYFTFDVLPTSHNLNVGDIVSADLIECERGTFIWRCLKLTVLERLGDVPKNNSHVLDGHAENRAVVVDPDMSCVLSSLFQKKEIEFTCTNQCDRSFSGHIVFSPRKSQIQVELVDAELRRKFVLGPHEKRTVRFVIESKIYGEDSEKFLIDFETFRIKRTISIIVCETEAEAEAIKQNLALEKTEGESRTYTATARNQNTDKTRRRYANIIWSNRGEVVPGVSGSVKARFVAYRIGKFDVPERLRNAYLTCESKRDMIASIEGMYPCISEDLNFSNYAKRFQILIYLEEIECFINFRKYDRERAHFTRDGEYLSLTIENLSETRPSLVVGDVVRAVNPWSDNELDLRSYDGVINKVFFNRVLLKFNIAFHEKYNGEDYRLEFYFSRFGFRKQHFAVERVVQHLGEHFLFPSKIHLREQPQLDVQLDKDNNIIFNQTKCKWYNQSLNPIQKKAVFNILRGEVQNMPYVIFGPPGTGKTITLVETILQLVKHLPSSRILVGTPSNSSADLITTRLIECGDLRPGDFIRLVSQNMVEKELIPEHLMPYCATADIAADGSRKDSMVVTDSGLKLKCQIKCLGRHRVTISTCSTLGNFIQMNFPKGHFTHVLIDESGQCTESQVMVAITQISRNRGQVILAGDPTQLPPIITNRYADEKGLGISFLERILSRSPYLKDLIRYPKSSGFDPRLVTKLLYSYRALPSILYVYNKLFYDSELIPVLSDDSPESKKIRQLSELMPDSETRSKTHGVFFYGILSENMQGNDSPSWYNPQEAKNVFLMTLQLYRQNIKPKDIGIIAPYAKQVHHLRTLFITADIAMPKIGSVEEFQGQERDIVLITTVRSSKKYVTNDIRHSLGFINSVKRINVAISRSRYLLYIFGNPYLLMLDPCWRKLIKYCVDNDAYSGCELTPDIYNEPSESNV